MLHIVEYVHFHSDILRGMLMELNLHIIAEDLKDFGIKSRIESDHLIRTLKYPALFDPEVPLLPEVLGVVLAEDIESLAFRRVGKNKDVTYSIFCIGEPNLEKLPAQCDIVWVPADVNLASTLSRITELFSRYNEWHLSLEKSVVRNKPLRMLGVLSQDILPFPMWVYDRQYQTLFHVCDKRRYNLPEGYVMHDDQSPWPAWEVDAWHEGVKSGVLDMDLIRSAERPYVLKGSRFSYSALCCNVFIGEGYEASVSIDDVGNGFTLRDEVVLSFFTDIITSAIRRDLATNTSITYALDQKLKRLLANEPVNEVEIRNAINTMGWNLDDPYLCITAHPTNPFYGAGMLVQVGEKVCKEFSNLIYEVVDRSIVFIKNRKADIEPVRNLAQRISDSLEEHSCKMQLGVSTIFKRFSFLFFYYRQGAKMIEWGREELENPQQIAIFFYDDYIMRSIVANICDHAAPEVACPTGLMMLIDYDKAHNGDLIPILHEYLNNNMYVSETARNLFIHRNTLINKLKKINEIMQIDLDNADHRIEIMLALRTLSSQRIIDVDGAHLAGLQ